jgi:hypothetical protein
VASQNRNRRSRDEDGQAFSRRKHVPRIQLGDRERQQGTEIKKQFLSFKFQIPANKARNLIQSLPSK